MTWGTAGDLITIRHSVPQPRNVSTSGGDSVSDQVRRRVAVMTIPGRGERDDGGEAESDGEREMRDCVTEREEMEERREAAVVFREEDE
ncbi:hypothetical protein Sjap_021004 [Stephania japonica]|uniref:Uncharacterized protein n=1 Tax=Stephania japonica TaxID=461633 RepID=A0AAP0F1S9_9MAGN